MAAYVTTPPSTARVEPGRELYRAKSEVRRWVPPAAVIVAGLGLVAALALPFDGLTTASLSAPGGVAIFLGNVTAMAGTYLLLIMVLVAARLPVLERVVGQDRMIRWHRLLSPAPLVLLGAHGVLTTLGFAQADKHGFFGEAGTLVISMAWIVAAIVSYLMLVGIAAVSIRAVRRRMNYDTWWIIHLYTYLALAISVPHQIFDGTQFIGHPLIEAAWLAFWLGTAGLVLLYRLGMPAYRSLRHRLRVVEIRPEGPGVFSLVVKGRHVEKLAASGGQYFAWRFLIRGLWWHAHPFSLSAMPTPPYLRVTVKVAGDTTTQIAKIRSGTPIAIEGPYGAFTADARSKQKVALVGAGVGITPLRAMLEDLPSGVDVVVLQRSSRPEGMILLGELRELVKQRHGRMVELVGSRSRHRLDDPQVLYSLVPDMASRDLFVCGPEGFSTGVISAAKRIGVPNVAIHCEAFAL